MVKDRVDESIEKHSFSDGLKGFGLVIIGLLIFGKNKSTLRMQSALILYNIFNV